jgi:hypothetical protein
MKPNFKVGQRVIVSENPEYKAAGPLWIPGGMDRTMGKVGVVSDVFASTGGWYVHISGYEFGGGYSYHEDWLSPAEDLDLHPKGLNIPVSELKRIYDVACISWMVKIQDMVKPFQETVFVSAEKIEEMLKAATSTQRPIVEDVFKTYLRESKPEFFDFGYVFSFDHSLYNSPIHIRHGKSTLGNNGKEIGFNEEYTPILVDKDGKETELTDSHYLKFKFKK